MSDWKEVWHVWDGNGEAPPSVAKAICQGHVLIDDSVYLNSVNSNQDWFGNIQFIQAYTTGQKRRRVECKTCHGLGFLSYGQFGPIIDCEHCDMKGYQWEYKDNE